MGGLKYLQTCMELFGVSERYAIWRQVLAWMAPVSKVLLLGIHVCIVVTFHGEYVCLCGDRL